MLPEPDNAEFLGEVRAVFLVGGKPKNNEGSVAKSEIIPKNTEGLVAKFEVIPKNTEDLVAKFEVIPKNTEDLVA